MASRAKQKEAARARHVAKEGARLERERRQRRVRVLGGVVLAAVAVVAVAIALSSSGGGSSGLRTGNGAAKLAAQVQQLLAEDQALPKGRGYRDAVVEGVVLNLDKESAGIL